MRRDAPVSPPRALVSPPAAVLAEIAEARAAAHAEVAGGAVDAVAEVRDIDAGGVPTRLYVPHDDTGITLLYLHGGGFAFGDLTTHDPTARRLASRTGCAVVLVDYRRSPEHRFPAAADDTLTAARWWSTAARGHGRETDRVIGVGDSAGANLVLGAALADPRLFAGLVLVYPFVDASCRTYDVAMDAQGLSIEDCELFWGLYAGRDADYDNPLFDPWIAPSFSGLPSTLLQVAELDVLAGTAVPLAERFAGDGVPLTVHRYRGVPHGFWRRHTEHPSAAEAAMAELVTWLRTSWTD